MSGPAGDFFGELYLRSTRPLLSEECTAAEVRYLRQWFQPGAGAVADLGCGHGRHAAALRGAGVDVIGLDVDALSLRQGLPGLVAVRADLRALPFATGSLAGAYSWYSSLFIFDDAAHEALLREIARTLRPGAPLVLHSAPYERLLEAPQAKFTTTLPDGAVLSEESRFDLGDHRDHGQRRLELPDGRTLSGSYAIRYYPLPELTQLLNLVGFSVMWVHGGVDGSALTRSSTDLIVGATRRVERRHG